MTYGYRPVNWPAFQTELEQRGISPADIEKIELRPAGDLPATTDVTVTLRSGRAESWRQGQTEELPGHFKGGPDSHVNVLPAS